MQNYAIFYLVISLKSNSNNKTLHVVILTVNLVFPCPEKKERKGQIEKERKSLQ